MGPADFMTMWLLVTDQGRNSLTFVHVTEDFAIMDLENQSEGGTTIVIEFHGGCCSTHSLKTAGEEGGEDGEGGETGGWNCSPSILPTDHFVPLCIQSVGCRQESVHR